MSLRPDHSCGRQDKHETTKPTSGTSTPFSALQSPKVNGNGNGAVDEFLRLSQPQQDVLLLHGPRQKYSLEKAQDVPELKHDNEILIQVLAIGLNPVDWKGPAYGMVAPQTGLLRPSLTIH